MALSTDEIDSLRLLLREQLRTELRPFRDEVNERFDTVLQHLDGLYQHDRKREQEYVAMKERIARLEKKRA